MFLIYSYLILLIGQNQIRTVCRFIQNYIELLPYRYAVCM
jgi:hypothetical protein